jgi:hypothetical protein
VTDARAEVVMGRDILDVIPTALSKAEGIVGVSRPVPIPRS